MFRGDFLTGNERADLTALARNGLAEHRVARRANAILLLDKGWSFQKVAEALLLDDDTVREWRGLFGTSGVEGLSRFEMGGGASFLTAAQEAQVKAWIVETLPRTTRVVGVNIRREFGVEYESRSGLIKLLHRLGLEYQKPEVIGRKLDAVKQKAFIEAYENLLNSLGSDEVVLFGDAVHPTQSTRPVGSFLSVALRRGLTSMIGTWPSARLCALIWAAS
jgi:transposase